MKFLILLLFPFFAHADWFFDPHIAVGYNPAQGTNYRLGADIGVHLDENFRVGVGGYYSAGERPRHDREIGAGPFVGYVQPVTTFLMFSARQEIDYVDQRYPYKIGQDWFHDEEYGVISATTGAVHIYFTPNFVVSGGYRLVIALNNSRLDDDRSGAFFGFGFGI